MKVIISSIVVFLTAFAIGVAINSYGYAPRQPDQLNEQALEFNCRYIKNGTRMLSIYTCQHVETGNCFVISSGDGIVNAPREVCR